MGPDAEEILELMQKQDDMVEVLQAEMDVCKGELRSLADYCRQKEAELEKVQAREIELLEELESLKNSKETKDLETPILQNSESSDLEAVIEMGLKVKELEFEIERERMTAKSKNVEFEMKKNHLEQMNGELEAEIQMRKTNEIQNLAKIESLSKQVAEWKAKFEVLSSRKTEEIMKLESRLEISGQREAQFDEHIRQILEEQAVTRQEKIVANARVTALVEETASLRAKILRLSRPSTSNFDPDKKEMQKLLNDQSHLISVLREETKLLANKLEHDSREYRQAIKKLKYEKRDLEERIRNLLRI